MMKVNSKLEKGRSIYASTTCFCLFVFNTFVACFIKPFKTKPGHKTQFTLSDLKLRPAFSFFKDSFTSHRDRDSHTLWCSDRFHPTGGGKVTSGYRITISLSRVSKSEFKTFSSIFSVFSPRNELQQHTQSTCINKKFV